MYLRTSTGSIAIGGPRLCLQLPSCFCVSAWVRFVASLVVLASQRLEFLVRTRPQKGPAHLRYVGERVSGWGCSGAHAATTGDRAGACGAPHHPMRATDLVFTDTASVGARSSAAAPEELHAAPEELHAGAVRTGTWLIKRSISSPQ